MESENNLPFYKIIIDSIQIFFKQIKNVFILFNLEIQLAKQSVLKVIILGFILNCLLISTWLSLLILIFFYIISLHFSYLAASLAIFALNAALLFAISLIMFKLSKNILFLSTRKQLKNLTSAEMDYRHEKN